MALLYLYVIIVNETDCMPYQIIFKFSHNNKHRRYLFRKKGIR